ncbi:MAG: 4Fe-4S binding protein [bacterium]|nr:MAG: 4Fe-4S binding protein [bacterium]
MAVRTIVQIDEDKCDGCGLCVPGCAEGALQIVDGKAKLVSDVYCDGLGACLGECPQEAITLVQREADEFDEEAVNHRLKKLGREPISHGHEQHAVGDDRAHEPAEAAEAEIPDLACGCPGTLTQSFDRPKPAVQVKAPAHRSGTPAPLQAASGCPSSRSQQLRQPSPAAGAPASAVQAGPVDSRLGNWPVQIMLIPPKAPYLEGADLLIAADCAPFAYGDFHRRFMEGKVLLIGCPKLDNTDVYLKKLSTIFSQNDINSIGVVYMEVPCCSGLVQIVKMALQDSGRDIPTTLYRVGIKGDFVEERALPGAAA